MDERKPSRLKVWTPLLFSFIMIFGMVLGFQLRDSLRYKRDISTIIERNDRLEQIIDLVKEKYVDSVNTNALYNDAVNGIISHLDPHTVYITPDELAAVNEDLEGSFFGIGVEFAIIKDTIQIMSVISEGPAAKVNVEIGEQIIKVGDSLVAGTHITSERIIRMLRGKENSKVPVTLHAPLSNRTRNVIIQRGAIPLYSLDASFMLHPSVGYIRINRFSATTYEEFSKAMQQLMSQGMQHLILDLRQNPGGYLEAATSIVSDFLDSNKLIVYTEGRNSKRAEYNAGDAPLFKKGRLAVLIDESSASASEIVAGAIQDWDRGIIVGRRSFGKGLVQSQYELGDGSAIRLTTAKYYTPSGRCIQRSYAKGREAYVKDFNQRYHSGELTTADSNQLIASDTVKYYTSNKRVVYSGGGIAPDISVPYDTNRFNGASLTFVYSEELRNAIMNYYISHQVALKKFANVDAYLKQIDITALMQQVLSSLPESHKKTAERLLSKKETKDFVALQMKAQLARILFKNTGYYSVLSSDDHAIKKALEAISGSQYLSIIRR